VSAATIPVAALTLERIDEHDHRGERHG